MLEPMPQDPELQKIFQHCPYIDVVYKRTFRCNICAWEPQREFGMVPALEEHLKTKHGVEPQAGKGFWISGYGDTTIKRLLLHE